MKAKFIYEKFSEESDPIKDMNIGKKNQILKDLENIGIKEDDVIFFDDYSFFMKTSKNMEPLTFLNIQLKYFPPAKAKLINRLNNTNDDIKIIIDDAFAEGISLTDIKYIINYELSYTIYKGNRHIPSQQDLLTVEIYLQKLSRTKKKIKEEKENNIYIFIGYYDKVPVDVSGEQYYEKKFCVENMVKIDKYNVGQLQSISMMKLRAQVQYGTGSDKEGHVYMLTIPKDFMDKDHYYEIPEEFRDIIEKYKQRI